MLRSMAHLRFEYSAEVSRMLEAYPVAHIGNADGRFGHQDHFRLVHPPLEQILEYRHTCDFLENFSQIIFAQMQLFFEEIEANIVHIMLVQKRNDVLHIFFFFRSEIHVSFASIG